MNRQLQQQSLIVRCCQLWVSSPSCCQRREGASHATSPGGSAGCVLMDINMGCDGGSSGKNTRVECDATRRPIEKTNLGWRAQNKAADASSLLLPLARGSCSSLPFSNCKIKKKKVKDFSTHAHWHAAHTCSRGSGMLRLQLKRR